MNGAFGNLCYEDEQQQVSWHGVGLSEDEAFQSFISKDVASRLQDQEGANEFEAHLRGLAGTGFARDSLEQILAADVPEERDWAVGEAIAEAWLSGKHGVIWPWNMERDKRTPKASLPGADLVGFRQNGDETRLVLGEVKTSSEEKTPPQVMNGRGGMKHQIDGLATNLGLIIQVLKWLWPRCKHTDFERSFDEAVVVFLESGNKAVSLFGILIRDTAPNELDLRSRGQALAKTIQSPTTCQLMALYLPCAVSDLPARLTRGKQL